MKLIVIGLILMSFFMSSLAKASACIDSGRMTPLREGHLKSVVIGERILNEPGNFDHVRGFVKRLMEGKVYDPFRILQAMARIQMTSFLATLDASMEVALGPKGPFMHKGPLAYKGPIADAAWSPNFFWTKLVEGGMWDHLPKGMRFLFEWGPTTLYGPGGPWGAKLSLYRREVDLVESYSESYMRRAKELDTSYTALLREAVGQEFVHRSPRDQLVTVSVTPFSKNSPHFVEVLDAKGKRISRSENDVEKNVIVIEVAKNTPFKVRVVGESALGFRLTVIGAGRTRQEFREDPFFGPIVDFLGERRALRTLVVFGPFGVFGPGGPLGPFGDMGALPSRMRDAGLELLPDGRWRDRTTGRIRKSMNLD